MIVIKWLFSNVPYFININTWSFTCGWIKFSGFLSKHILVTFSLHFGFQSSYPLLSASCLCFIPFNVSLFCYFVCVYVYNMLLAGYGKLWETTVLTVTICSNNLAEEYVCFVTHNVYQFLLTWVSELLLRINVSYGMQWIRFMGFCRNIFCSWFFFVVCCDV
jgi:hypothetical protein